MPVKLAKVTACGPHKGLSIIYIPRNLSERAGKSSLATTLDAYLHVKPLIFLSLSLSKLVHSSMTRNRAEEEEKGKKKKKKEEEKVYHEREEPVRLAKVTACNLNNQPG